MVFSIFRFHIRCAFLNEINWNRRHISVSCQFLNSTIYFASTEAQPTNGTVDWVFRIEIWLAGCPNLNLWNFTHFINIYRLQMLISKLCSTKKIEASKQRESSGVNITRAREKKRIIWKRQKPIENELFVWRNRKLSHFFSVWFLMCVCLLFCGAAVLPLPSRMKLISLLFHWMCCYSIEQKFNGVERSFV